MSNLSPHSFRQIRTPCYVFSEHETTSRRSTWRSLARHPPRKSGWPRLFRRLRPSGVPVNTDGLRRSVWSRRVGLLPDDESRPPARDAQVVHLAGARARRESSPARSARQRSQRLLGHLWANRYFSTALDEHHLWCAVRYIELNPMRGGLVTRAEDFPWSSARAHANLWVDPLLSPSRPFPGSVRDWSSWLAQGRDPAAEALLRETSRTGRPCGSAAFVERAERELGRILKVQPSGRKMKGQVTQFNE